MSIEFLIHEGTLHESLTVIENAINLYGRDVLTESCELTLLNGRHLALGIEDIYVNTIHTQEAIGHCRARIAGGSNEDVHFAPAVGGSEVTEQARHKPCTHILKGQRGAMEEFKGIDIVLHVHHRGVEGEGVIDNLAKGISLYILAKEGIGYAIGNLLKGEVSDFVPKSNRQLLDDLGHIESAVLGETPDNSIAQRSACSFMIGTIVEHKQKDPPLTLPVREGVECYE